MASHGLSWKVAMVAAVMLLALPSVAAAEAVAAVVVDSAGSVTEDSARRLPQALPQVRSVDFQDFDLDIGQIGGNVTWVPPDDTSELNGYEVYFADGSGSVDSREYLGFVTLGTHNLSVPMHTNFTNGTYVFVHTRSVYGESPDGVGFAICDVNTQDSLFLSNEAPTTSNWAVVELGFYVAADCSGPALRWVEAGSSGASHNSTRADYAVDGDPATAWESSCSGCAPGAASIGVIGVCAAEEVRCVRIRQCGGDHLAGSGCPAPSGRAHWISLLVRGRLANTWKALPTGDLQGKLQEEVLVVSGRRRRAGFTRFSDAEGNIERQTNSGFTSR